MPEYDFILEVKNLKKLYYDKSTSIFGKAKVKHAVDDVSFNINKGEIFGIVGESGCGKSTLARSIVGLTRDIQGEIILDGEAVRNGKTINGGKSVSEKVQIVFQDPSSSLNPKKKIGWILEEPLKVHKIGSSEERKKRVDDILELVGLDASYKDRYPHELSGGQRQRISIGSAIILRPSLIVADEPVSALDVSVQAQILNLMQDLQHKFDFSYLFISHDLNVIYYMCSRVAVMYLGKIVELASVDEIYDNPLHPYTKALLSSIPEINSENQENSVSADYSDEVDTSEPVKNGCAFYGRCSKATDKCRESLVEGKLIKNDNGEEHFVRCNIYS